MSLTEYRVSPAERQRTEDLLKLMPASGGTALDIGARDGHFSLLLAERFERVIALDLAKPTIDHPRVECVQGDASALEFADRAVDFVFCAEVLEHIPSPALERACREMERVSRNKILIGVPYKQDIRVGRTTCVACKGKNPPWAHVNRFDERRLAGLFPACKIDTLSFVGETREQTNALSALLMDLAGNPYGTYMQEEPCIHCEARLLPPPERNIARKLLTKLAFMTRSATAIFARPHGNWIHLLLAKEGA